MSEIKRRSRRLGLGLGALFVAPVVIACLLYFYGDAKLFRAINKGELIKSPFNVTKQGLADYQQAPLKTNKKWLIIYSVKSCDTTCKTVLDKLLRVRMTLGKDMYRTRAYVATERKIPRSLLERVEAVKGFDTKGLLNSANKDSKIKIANIYIVDPHGNVILRYGETAPPSDLKSDLTRLLKVSKIG